MRGAASAFGIALGLAVSLPFALLPHHAYAQMCPANAEPYSTEETSTGTVTHCQCISGYTLGNGSCQPQATVTAARPPAHALDGNFEPFCSSKARLNLDRDAIAKLGFASNAASFEEYAVQATNHRNDFVLQAADSLFNMLLVDKAVEYGKSLNPWTVNTRIKELRAAADGAGTDAIGTALRSLARVRNKPAMAPYASNVIGETVNKLFETIKDAKLNAETKRPNSSGTPGYVGALILAGKLATANPWASLTISGAEMARTAAMAYGISKNVDRLSELNDEEMRQLEIYRRRLEKDLAATHAAQRAWQRATGQSRVPNCSVG